jgi:hypothetical protein
VMGGVILVGVLGDQQLVRYRSWATARRAAARLEEAAPSTAVKQSA